jgi:hypothetical protein
MRYPQSFVESGLVAVLTLGTRRVMVDVADLPVVTHQRWCVDSTGYAAAGLRLGTRYLGSFTTLDEAAAVADAARQGWCL